MCGAVAALVNGFANTGVFTARNQLRDIGGVDHHFGGRNIAFIDIPDQTLGDYALEVEREIGVDLVHLGFVEKVDDMFHGLNAVVGVQRRDAQVTGFGIPDRLFHGLAIADFTDQNDIRGFAQGVFQCIAVGKRINTDFTLVDQRLAVGVQ